MREVEERCHGKLNLFLDVIGRRHDGYHELVTVFHELDVADELIVREVPGRGGVVDVVVVPGDAAADDVPAGPDNLAARAATALLDARGCRRAVQIVLRKNVPTGAGLGGGSADAAGALRAVNRLFELEAAPRELETIAAAIGSDVPFLVRGGTALGRGRGELLEAIPAAQGLSFLLLVPSFAVSTRAVFDALPAELPPPVSAAALCRALETGDVTGIAAATHNALVPAALRAESRIAPLLAHLRAVLGEHVQMTGSGSTFFVPLRCAELPDTSGWPFGTRAVVVSSA